MFERFVSSRIQRLGKREMKSWEENYQKQNWCNATHLRGAGIQNQCFKRDYNEQKGHTRDQEKWGDLLRGQSHDSRSITHPMLSVQYLLTDHPT